MLQPQTLEPEVLEPEALEREVLQPEVLEPEVLEPEVLEPEALEPEMLEPEVLQPEALEPEALQPEALEPEALQPEALEPEALEPEALEPEMLEPEVLEPEVLQPGELTTRRAPTEVLQPEVLEPKCSSRKCSSRKCSNRKCWSRKCSNSTPNRPRNSLRLPHSIPPRLIAWPMCRGPASRAGYVVRTDAGVFVQMGAFAEAHQPTPWLTCSAMPRTKSSAWKVRRMVPADEFYRVRIGPIESMDALAALADSLEAEGFVPAAHVDQFGRRADLREPRRRQRRLRLRGPTRRATKQSARWMALSCRKERCVSCSSAPLRYA